MKRKEIIARRREFKIPGYKTLAEVGFDGEWVTPIQKNSHSKTGPVLICKDWLDWPSVDVHRDTLKRRWLSTDETLQHSAGSRLGTREADP